MRGYVPRLVVAAGLLPGWPDAGADRGNSDERRAGRTSTVQAVVQIRATVSSTPMLRMPGCEESASEPKEPMVVSALYSTARGVDVSNNATVRSSSPRSTM